MKPNFNLEGDKMTIQSIVKPVVLNTVEVVTAFTVSHLLNKAALTAIPDLGLWNGEWTRKEKAIQAAKVISIAVGAGVIAGFAGTAVRTATERIIWNDEEDIDPEN